MIGAITTGSNFRQLFNYLLKPTKKPEILGGNYVGNTPEELSKIFSAVAAQRPSTKKPVKHLVISFAPEDGIVSYEKKMKIAMETVHRLGYQDNQWVAIEHHRNDPDHYEKHDHDHIHIAINMVSYTGERVSDSFDKWRMQKILRSLEIKYDLKRVISSLFRNRRRPKQGSYKKF
ncbi:MAG: relaxase/mobilization nuclease domain-containing protein, partial [Waterburya sp.]